MITEELRQRLLRESWLLRSEADCFESFAVNGHRNCKLCEQQVPVLDTGQHWRDHVRQRASIRRTAEKRRVKEATARLTRWRKMNGG